MDMGEHSNSQGTHSSLWAQIRPCLLSLACATLFIAVSTPCKTVHQRTPSSTSVTGLYYHVLMVRPSTRDNGL